MIDRVTSKRDSLASKTHRAGLNGGRPLSREERGFFEPRFAHDFSRVRVHADQRAVGLATALGARAFVTGSDVVLGSHANTRDVLAHELTHVVQNERGKPANEPSRTLSDPSDAAEREADDSRQSIERGSHLSVRAKPSAAVARDKTPALAGPPGATSAPTPPPLTMRVFDDPNAWTPAGSSVALDRYLALDPVTQAFARSSGYASGGLTKTLQALGPVNAADPKYATAVHDVLRWIEETATRKSTGMSDAAMASVQAASGLIKPKSAAGAPPNWGGATKGRFEGLLPQAKTDWTNRGNKAIAAMVAYAASHAPELKLAAATFELKFDELDKDSLGAMAAGGSVPGTTVMVGFEFTVTTEVNPAYALSTVVHELKGHPMYEGGASYQGSLYQKAAALVPGDVDRTGVQTYDFWPSEIYSLMKEIPYWSAVTPADAAKSLTLPGSKTGAAATNYDPRIGIGREIDNIKTFWAPSLVNGMLRGFYQRVSNDPSMQSVATDAFKQIVRSKFSSADADVILK